MNDQALRNIEKNILITLNDACREFHDERSMAGTILLRGFSDSLAQLDLPNEHYYAYVGAVVSDHIVSAQLPIWERGRTTFIQQWNECESVMVWGEAKSIAIASLIELQKELLYPKGRVRKLG